MGGFGSTRWGYYSQRRTAEESKRLTLKPYKTSLREIERGEVLHVMYRPSWTRGNEPAGNINLTFDRGNGGIRAEVNYTVTDREGPHDYRYEVGLTATPTPWGASRYWWTCPHCGRRCGTLYLPPGQRIFACRKCHGLTYTSCQESHKYDTFIKSLIGDDGFHGLSVSEVVNLLKRR